MLFLMSNTLYANSIELIRGAFPTLPLIRHKPLTRLANARLLYGRHLIYNLVIITKNTWCIAYLIGYYKNNTLAGTVLAMAKTDRAVGQLLEGLKADEVAICVIISELKEKLGTPCVIWEAS
jgi:hypothetical protein